MWLCLFQGAGAQGLMDIVPEGQVTEIASKEGETPPEDGGNAPGEEETPAPTEEPGEGPAPTTKPYEPVTVSASATPAELVSPGEVSVSVRLVNDGDDTIRDVTLMGPKGEVLLEPSKLPLGKTLSWKGKIRARQSHIDKGGIPLTVSYLLAKGTDEERVIEKTVTVRIRKAKTSPKVEFTRSISSRLAYPGQEVTLSYTVRNTGNVALTDIQVKDPLFGTVGSLDELETEKRKTFTKKLTLETKSVSKPTISYKAKGEKKRLSASVKESSIQIAQEELLIDLSVSQDTVPSGGQVHVTLTLTNNGNVDYRKLRLSDEVLGEIVRGPTELKAGESYVYRDTVTIKQDTAFAFTITGKDSTNRDIHYTSQRRGVTVSAQTAEDIRLKVEASAQPSMLASPQPVRFTLKLLNQGDFDLRNVTISEKNQGDIRVMAVIPPGQTQIEQSYDVHEETEFLFSASLEGQEQGFMYTVNANPVKISFESGQVQPTSSPAPQAGAQGANGDAAEGVEEDPGMDPLIPLDVKAEVAESTFPMPDRLTLFKVGIAIVGSMILVCMAALGWHSHKVNQRKKGLRRPSSRLSQNTMPPPMVTRTEPAPGSGWGREGSTARKRPVRRAPEGAYRRPPNVKG